MHTEPGIKLLRTGFVRKSSSSTIKACGNTRKAQSQGAAVEELCDGRVVLSTPTVILVCRHNSRSFLIASNQITSVVLQFHRGAHSDSAFRTGT